MKKIFLFLSCIALLGACKDNSKSPENASARDSGATAPPPQCNLTITPDQLKIYKGDYRTWVMSGAAGINVFDHLTLNKTILINFLNNGSYTSLQLEPVKIGDTITVLVEGIRQGVSKLDTVFTDIRCLFKNPQDTPPLPADAPNAASRVPTDPTTRNSIFCPPPACTYPPILDRQGGKPGTKDSAGH